MHFFLALLNASLLADYHQDLQSAKRYEGGRLLVQFVVVIVVHTERRLATPCISSFLVSNALRYVVNRCTLSVTGVLPLHNSLAGDYVNPQSLKTAKTQPYSNFRLFLLLINLIKH